MLTVTPADRPRPAEVPPRHAPTDPATCPAADSAVRRIRAAADSNSSAM
jgi:hypothetical protein